MKKIITTSLIILLFCAFYIIPSSLFEIQKNIDIFVTFYKKINKEYVDEVNPNLLMQAAINGVLKKLDPYTVFIPEETVVDSIVKQNQELGKLGLDIKNINYEIYITSVAKKSTAMQAGIKIGDKIVSIENIIIENKAEEEVYRLLNGAINTRIDLKIERQNDEEKTIININVKREHRNYNSLSFRTLLNDNIAYIKINEFTEHIGEKTRNTLDSLINIGAKSVILDLRDNPGGLLYEAVLMSNIFLPKQTDIVSIKGKNPARTKRYKTQQEPLDTEIPLAILISKKSASASEIVAGVMQDYDRGIIIGEQSYGKGLVQVNIPLSYNSQSRVTIAKYYTPSGRCIQAIDYSVPIKQRKSIKSAEFETENGRKVIDGMGIIPDIVIFNNTKNTLIGEIKKQGYFFMFAREYISKSINGKNFCQQEQLKNINQKKIITLENKVFDDFVKYILENINNYNIKTPLMKAFQKLYKIKTLTPSQEYSQQLKKMKEAINQQYIRQLISNKTVYKTKILEYLIHHCNGNTDRKIASTWNDMVLKRAINVLNDKKQYNLLLNKPQ